MLILQNLLIGKTEFVEFWLVINMLHFLLVHVGKPSGTEFQEN
jgi:hypothetical protein